MMDFVKSNDELGSNVVTSFDQLSRELLKRVG
jgi:hypothetical protein